MALAVQSIRAAAEHRDILRMVADLLREGQADTLRHLLTDISERPVGPFRSEDAALAFIRDRLVARLRPRMVWLFGSRARGDARLDSDFDLLVVLPDGLPDRSYDHGTVAEPLVACGLGCDVVPCSWAAFEADRAVSGSLVERVVREGHILYQDRHLRRAARASA